MVFESQDMITKFKNIAYTFCLFAPIRHFLVWIIYLKCRKMLNNVLLILCNSLILQISRNICIFSKNCFCKITAEQSLLKFLRVRSFFRRAKISYIELWRCFILYSIFNACSSYDLVWRKCTVQCTVLYCTVYCTVQCTVLYSVLYCKMFIKSPSSCIPRTV